MEKEHYFFLSYQFIPLNNFMIIWCIKVIYHMDPALKVILNLLNKEFCFKVIENSIKCDNNHNFVVYILNSWYI